MVISCAHIWGSHSLPEVGKMSAPTIFDIQKRRWDRITDPVEALEVLATHSHLGQTPAISEALREMAGRVARQARQAEQPTYLKTANGVTFAIEPKDA